MKQNNWAYSATPIDVYRVSSKGIRLIRTIYPGGKPNEHPKPSADDPKPRKGEDKPHKPE